MSVDFFGSILGTVVAAKGFDLLLHSAIPLLSDAGKNTPKTIISSGLKEMMINSSLRK